MSKTKDVDRAPVHAVVMLPSKVVQIQAASQPGDSNSGPHVQLFALCEDGSVWCQYQSSGYSNVPTDGRWYSVVNPVEMDQPKLIERAKAVESWFTTPNVEDAHKRMPDDVFYGCFALVRWVLRYSHARSA